MNDLARCHTNLFSQPGLAEYREIEELRTNWKRLHLSLPRTKLRQLLGKPRPGLVLGQQTLWYYRYPVIGGGSMLLDSNGKVTGWQASRSAAGKQIPGDP